MLEAPERGPLLADDGGRPSRAGGVVAEFARHVDAPRAVVDRAGWSAHRRAHHGIAERKDGSNGLTASTISLGPRGNDTFDHAKSGDCLNWPDRTPDAAEIVDCKDEHRFEVAESVDMRTFPGSEYGPDAAPPSPARIQQISQEQCSAAVQALPRRPVRPEQPVHRQHAVVGRQGVAAVG